MEPVRIKLYGMFWMTRRRYMAQLIVGGLLVVLLLSVWFIHWLTVREQAKALDSPELARIVALLDLTPFVVLVIAALQAVEAYFVLRAFARKQAAALAAVPGPPPPPPPDAPPGELASRTP